MCTILDPLK